jgi:MOSC domain-containing protein YiiM
MKRIDCILDSVYLGTDDHGLGKESCLSLNAQLSGFVGDRHGSYFRETWAGDDKQQEGTTRRNERQWSAVSLEELAIITDAMDLKEPLLASSLGANLCFSGLPNISKLPKGSIFRFPSGAELVVEEYNPPCLDMDEKLISMHTPKTNSKLYKGDFLSAAKYCRGIVGVVEVPGMIHSGDKVVVLPYKNPSWIEKSS